MQHFPNLHRTSQGLRVPGTLSRKGWVGFIKASGPEKKGERGAGLLQWVLGWVGAPGEEGSRLQAHPPHPHGQLHLCPGSDLAGPHRILMREAR